MTDTRLVRIRPGSPRRQHVIAGKTFMQERGWYETPLDLAAKCEAERVSELDPTSPHVFEVKTHQEAAQVVVAERAAATGTVERPNVIPAPPEEEAPAAPRVGKRAAAEK